MACLQNPKLLYQAETRIEQLFDMPPCRESLEADAKQVLRF
jgi:hypothetical protein